MLIATPNLCLDITIRLPKLVPGTVSRAHRTDTTAGGKGVNVARCARALGAEPILAGFLPLSDGERFEALLAGEGTQLLGIPVPGQLRLASIIIGDDGVATVINGRGPEIDAEHWQLFTDRLGATLPGQDVLICSGSLPPGLPDTAYATLTALGHAGGLPVLVDAAPTALRSTLAEQPDLVSPNLSEAEGLLFGRFDEQVDEQGDGIPERAVHAAARLHQAGAVRAVVTAGGCGAALATEHGTWWLPAPPVRVLNPIGAGDCFAAGAALAIVRGATDLDVVRHGMATASASCESPMAGTLRPGRAAELFDVIHSAASGAGQ